MNILLLHQYFLELDDSGGSRFNEMVKVWAEEGHTIEVLAGMVHYGTGQKLEAYKGKFYLRREQPGATVHRCHVSQSYNTNFLGRLWAYLSFVVSTIFVGFTKLDNRPDVIVVTSPPLFVGISAVLFHWFWRKPYVFEVRDLWPESAIDTGVLRNKTTIKAAYWFESFVYKHAGLINVLTPAFRTKLIEEKGVPPAKVTMIPNAADFKLSDKIIAESDRHRMRKSLGWTDKVVVTYVGAHGVANHLEQLLETAALLKHVPQVQFVLIGSGMRKEALVSQAEALDLPNVSFIDPVPKHKVFEYIYASDFGASVLKRVDTFKTIYSNKTFDYMACKRPILLAIDGVSRELIEAAGCGTFIEPERPKAFASTIQDYLSSSSERRVQEGEAGYAYAKRHFDRSVLAKKYLEHIFNIAERY